ncbi:MAG: hypothetical protein EPO20_27555 [Betaproteobacteria bacterium]|nr:MAG: hypothetical protein EPO20_27555 [Betaproteobacteria bacterium]
MAARIVPSTCEECSVRCGSLIHIEDDRVVKISGNPRHPHSQGAFCIKGMHGPVEAREHPDRPLRPLRRVGARGEGKWEKISWNRAFDEIADRLGQVKRNFGSTSIAGAVSSQLVNRGVAMALLLRSLGTPNYMINQDLCQGGRLTAGHLTGLGGAPGVELPSTHCILVIGKSPSDSSVVQWMQIKSAKRRGAKLIVADPRRTQIARLADLWLPIKPGTDAALALSMINVLFAENLVDSAFVGEWCLGAEELRERARRYDPATAAAITGVPADSIVNAARLFATEKPGCMVLGHGIDAQANGAGTAMAFYALLALTGNVDRPGANRLPTRLPGFRDYVATVNDGAFRMPAEKEQLIIGGKEYPFWSGPDSWAKAAHNPSIIKAINTGDPYPVRALYISGVNIVCTYPGMQDTIAALKSLELLVVATDHITPTAELADFVLPKTTLLEEEAVFQDPGAPCISIIQQVLPPRGEVKTDFEIAISLRDKLKARNLIDFDLLPWNSDREFIDFQLEKTGLNFDDLRSDGFFEYSAGYEKYRKVGFNTPSKKIELYSNKLNEAGYDPLPDYISAVYAEPEGSFDLTLLTGIRSMAYHHSRFRNHRWARKRQNEPELRIHPKTAERFGIGEDEWVKVETPRGAGAAYLKAWITDEVPEKIVATGMGWWYPEIAGADRGALKLNVETAIPYGPPWDRISGSAEARNCACRISRADLGQIPQQLLNVREAV